MRYRFEDCELDTDLFEMYRAGKVVKLEPQVFDVLVYLLQHRDRVVPKHELLDEVWGDHFVSESALSSRIKAARQAVGDDGRLQRCIRTVHGRGYRFVAHTDEITGDRDVTAAAPRAAAGDESAEAAAVPLTSPPRSGTPRATASTSPTRSRALATSTSCLSQVSSHTSCSTGPNHGMPISCTASAASAA
jgi:DNA-binding winged helix-turn-helix (wHTH) protein